MRATGFVTRSSCSRRRATATHGVIRHLNLKAAVPFAPRTPTPLSRDLDDVVDFAEEVADFMGVYRVEAPTDHAIALAARLHAAGGELPAALVARSSDLPRARPRHPRRCTASSTRATILERRALTSLFDGGIDPMVVIRWKDIHERLEEGIDAAAHVGRTLAGLLYRRL